MPVIGISPYGDGSSPTGSQSAKQRRKRLRTRLHRWPWAQLHAFITYKAEAARLRVIYVNPSYSSQTAGLRSVCQFDIMPAKAWLAQQADTRFVLPLKR